MGGKAGKCGPRARLKKLEQIEEHLEFTEENIYDALLHVTKTKVVVEEKYLRAIEMLSDSLVTAKKQVVIILDSISDDIEPLEKEDST